MGCRGYWPKSRAWARLGRPSLSLEGQLLQSRVGWQGCFQKGAGEVLWRGVHGKQVFALTDAGRLGSPHLMADAHGWSQPQAQPVAPHTPWGVEDGKGYNKSGATKAQQWGVNGNDLSKKHKEGIGECYSEKPQSTQLEAVSGDPYLPRYEIRKLMFLLLTTHSPKANSFPWVSIYYHLKCHSLYG